MDLTVQAMSGAMHVTGFPDRPPVKAGPAVSDFLGGTHLYGAIMTALYERSRTGRGRVVEIAMQDTMIPAMASNLQLYFENPNGQPRVGNRHGALAMAPYNTYPASDGHVAIMCVTDQHWRALCQAMGREDLASDPEWATHEKRCRDIDATDAIVAAWTGTRTRQQLAEEAQRWRVPCAPVRDLQEVLHDAHLHERGMLRWVDHPVLGRVTLPHSPLRFDGSELLPLQPEPGLGQHNADILQRLDQARAQPAATSPAADAPAPRQTSCAATNKPHPGP